MAVDLMTTIVFITYKIQILPKTVKYNICLIAGGGEHHNKKSSIFVKEVVSNSIDLILKIVVQP